MRMDLSENPSVLLCRRNLWFLPNSSSCSPLSGSCPGDLAALDHVPWHLVQTSWTHVSIGISIVLAFDCHCPYSRPHGMGNGFWSAGNSNGVFRPDVPVGLFSLIVAYRREKKLLSDRARWGFYPEFYFLFSWLLTGCTKKSKKSVIESFCLVEKERDINSFQKE